MNAAPNKAPLSDATPPTIKPTNRNTDTDREAVGRDELDRDRAEGARDAGIHGADRKRPRLQAGDIDAHGLGSERMVTDRHHGAADPASDQVPGEQEQQRRRPPG